jgi:hypothetical protein
MRLTPAVAGTGATLNTSAFSRTGLNTTTTGNCRTTGLMSDYIFELECLIGIKLNLRALSEGRLSGLDRNE